MSQEEDKPLGQEPVQDSEKKSRPWIWFLPLVVFALLSVLFYSRLGHDPAYLPSAMVGQELPGFELSALQSDENITSGSVREAFAGEPFLLNVWASWCPSCYDEHPFLMYLQQQGVAIVGINYKDEKAKAMEFIASQGNPFSMVIVDKKGDLGLDLGVYGAPETFLVGREGRILHRHAGPMTAEVWKSEFVSRMNYE